MSLYTPIDMKDVGTREKHYVELLELMADTKAIHERKSFHSHHDKMVMEELTICMYMLKKVFESQADYDEDKYRKEIDECLKPRTSDSSPSTRT